MKVIHKNSREEFDLFEPRYYKYYSMYGLLVMGGKDVFFISDASENNYECVTEDFEIINE